MIYDVWVAILMAAIRVRVRGLRALVPTNCTLSLGFALLTPTPYLWSLRICMLPQSNYYCLFGRWVSGNACQASPACCLMACLPAIQDVNLEA